MTDQVVAVPAPESPEDEATSQEVASSEDTQGADPEATWRKRLNGQTAATNKAIAERDALRAKVEAFEAKERETQMAGLSEVERLKTEKADAERRAQEAETKADNRVLDKLYPKARAEFPEIRDEIRLVKLEAAFSDNAPVEQDTTRSMRAPKKEAQPAQSERSSADIFASLPRDWPS